jgi:hypothetical protein
LNSGSCSGSRRRARSPRAKTLSLFTFSYIAADRRSGKFVFADIFLRLIHGANLSGSHP